jgi:hypothetical protein
MESIAPGLFVTTADGPRLVGGRRKADGRIVFPAPAGAEAEHFETVQLAPRGTLWSFTIQRFRPKSPPYAGADDERSFRPFALGYIELPDQVIVESRIETTDFGALRIGMPMRLALRPFARQGADDAMCFVFEPDQEARP